MQRDRFFTLVLLLPVELLGIGVFLLYVATHWHDFIGQSAVIFSWLAWFAALLAYVGLAWFAIRVLRALLDAVLAFVRAMTEVAEKRAQMRLVHARQALLHTDRNYVVFLQDGVVTVQAIAQTRSSSVPVMPVALPESDVIESLPAAIQTFRELIDAGVVQEAIARGQMLLGYVEGQLRYGSWLDLYSCGIGGVSGSGKTTTVRFLLLQAVLAGAQLVMIDPHIAHKEESLAAQFQRFDVHAMPPCDETPAQVARRIKFLANECDRRKMLGETGPALVAVFDEFNAIIRRLPDDLRRELADLLLTIAQEGRKFGIFAMLIGQRWSEQDLGGKNYGAAIRSSLASTLAHRFTDEDQAKKLIGGRNGPRCLELQQGHYLFRDTEGVLSETITPYTADEDAEAIALLLSRDQKSQRNQYQQLLSSASGGNQGERDTHADLQAVATEHLDPRVRQVLRLQAEGRQKAEIIKALWGVSPGGSQAYEQANAEYQQVMRQAYEQLGA